MSWIKDLIDPKGRAWEEFYRNRNQCDKVVRSTHGVNCTGSCSWNVHVKDGIVGWELQATDYPELEPGLPPMSHVVASAASLSPGTSTARCALSIPTCAAFWPTSGVQPRPSMATRSRLGLRLWRTRTSARAISRRVAKVASGGSAGTNPKR